MNPTEAHTPGHTAWLLAAFTWYSRRYVRRHFHSLRVSRAGLPPSPGLPLVLYTNHASWWDPLICLVLKARFFPRQAAFVPMDAAALQRYPIFRRLGFFGVEPGSRRGAALFLRLTEAVLRDPGNILAITPQGRFADARERPARFQAGLGHLAARANHAAFIPMATEYVFWEERLPEILVRFGPALEVRQGGTPNLPPEGWTRLFERELEATQDALAEEARNRRPEDFQHLLQGGAGQGGIYDAWRAAGAWLQGKPFSRAHGTR